MGGVIYAGVDYEHILQEAEKDGDVIIWDGGNNDFPFYKPDLFITLADPHRAGHELMYYPGSINVITADVVIINKVNTADQKNVEKVRANVKLLNPSSTIIDGISNVITPDPTQITGKKVLVIEDGPTVTHGSMRYGAGWIAAEAHGASDIIDPRPYAVGSIKEIYTKYTHLLRVLPAMGYGQKQIAELETTINKAACDVVVSGTPIDLNRILTVNKPIIRVKYGVGEKTTQDLERLVDDFIKQLQ